MKSVIDEYIKLKKEYERFDKNKIPLCAAETFLSERSRAELSSIWEGKYCMGNLDFDPKNDFIGGQYVHRLFDLVSEECHRLFGSVYADARTLSGMNCMAIAIQSVFKAGDKVLITSSDQGGHPSLPYILLANGIEYEEIPYSYSSYDIDYKALNTLLLNKHFDGLIFCQSDLLNPADLSRIYLHGETVIYDASQTLGLIGAKIQRNPMDDYPQTILLGGTHKTLPGPTCGLIMAKGYSRINELDKDISPRFLRSVQPNNIASLLVTLCEQEENGKEYQQTIVSNANKLGEKLEKLGFVLAKIGSEYTKTHQLFLLMSQKEMDKMYADCGYFGVTLNKKHKKLFGDFGIRIGVQEISGYGWGEEELDQVAVLLAGIRDYPEVDEAFINKIADNLATKKGNAYFVNNLIE